MRGLVFERRDGRDENERPASLRSSAPSEATMIPSESPGPRPTVGPTISRAIAQRKHRGRPVEVT